jgi:quercetin dioxygenase-like cupin family protein
MDPQKGHLGTERRNWLWGILPKRFKAALSSPREGTTSRSRPIRPVSLLVASLAMLAITLGVIGLVMPAGSVQATPGTGTTLENLGRATLGPFRIIQESEPDPLSTDTTDVTMHKVTMDVDGNSGWHIHPGLTFGIVTQGRVEFTRITKGGCVKQVFSPGEGFVEPANELHIARNVGEEPMVMYLTRLNIPVGGATTDSSPEEPDCSD